MFTISCPPKVVWLGREGENEFRTIEVEVSEWLREYPNGTISVVYHRPDDSIYMPTVTTSGNITRWLITSTDTSFTGRGEAEFRIIDGDVIGKSVKMPTMVSDGINATTDDPDSAPADWTVEAGRLQNEIDDLDERVEELEQHGTGGGIPDAPADGKQYARQNNEWSEVQSGTSYDDTELRNRIGTIEGKEAAWDANTEARHTHSNKTILDGITAEKITAWDNATHGTTVVEQEINYAGFELGALTSGAGEVYYTDTRFVSSNMVKLAEFKNYNWNTANYYSQYEFYDSNKAYQSALKISWTKTKITADMFPTGAAYMRILLRRTDNGVCSSADIEAANPIITINHAIVIDGDSAPQRYKLQGYETIAYSSVGIAPINTAEHFEYCASREYTMFKVDVRPTSDGKLICCHDAGFTFDSNGRVIAYNSESATPIHSIAYATAISYEHATKYNGAYCKVIGLEDYLKICTKYNRVPYITVRDEYVSEVVAELKKLLIKYSFDSRAIINSATRDSLSAVRDALPNVTLCIFCNPFGSSMASAYNFVKSHEDTILSYYYNQSGHTWAEFIADADIASYIALCNVNGYQQIACIESDMSHEDVLIRLGFNGCHITGVLPSKQYLTLATLPKYNGGVR